jgi:signal transduction histidine kinase
VNKLLRSVEVLVRGSLAESIDVQIVSGAGVWPVEADSTQLESAIVNLALNARDAMPNGGRKLTIETDNMLLDEAYCRKNPEVPPGQYVRISVSDTGTGMPQDVVEKAFEPFSPQKLQVRGLDSA